MRILIIEDELDLLSVVSKTLREQGYAVDTATDGTEGLYSEAERDPSTPAPGPRPPGPHPILLECALTNAVAGRYVAVWFRDGRQIIRTPGVPPELTRPATRAAADWVEETGSHIRSYRYTPRGECLMIGTDSSPKIAGVHTRMARLMIGGLIVLILGLLVGWFVTGRALRPIREITEAAQRISQGDLSQRVATQDQFSELGELASMLNDTFHRLEKVFTQQARFTSDAAHELRTPVAIMRAQTQAALMRDRSPEEYKETIESCHRAANRMQKLIEALLALARFDANREPTRLVPLDLATLVKETIEATTSITSQRRIRVEASLDPAPCHGDPVQLGQVLSNLVANAVFYNRDDGTIRIVTSQNAGFAELVIADTGRGIPESELPNLFTRFHRVDKSRNRGDGGTGLGLAITKSIVEKHHGNISVASQLGAGSTFTVRIPTNDPHVSRSLQGS